MPFYFSEHAIIFLWFFSRLSWFWLPIHRESQLKISDNNYDGSPMSRVCSAPPKIEALVLAPGSAINISFALREGVERKQKESGQAILPTSTYSCSTNYFLSAPYFISSSSRPFGATMQISWLPRIFNSFLDRFLGVKICWHIGHTWRLRCCTSIFSCISQCKCDRKWRLRTPRPAWGLKWGYRRLSPETHRQSVVVSYLKCINNDFSHSGYRKSFSLKN